MDGMENKVEYTVYRDHVEKYIGTTLSDREWEVLATDIESFMEYAIWQQMAELYEELPQSMEQDDKFLEN